MELAERYMGILYGGGRLEELEELLADDLKFEGPLFKFGSAREYIDSLKADPPEGFGYQLIRAWEDETSACLVYMFSKPGVTTPMAQYFQTDGGRITRILLVFDTGAFMG